MTDGIRSFIAQRKQLILTNSKNILLTISKQHNSYNLFLWAIA